MPGGIHVTQATDADVRFNRWLYAVSWTILFWLTTWLTVTCSEASLWLPVTLAILGPIVGWQVGYKRLIGIGEFTVLAPSDAKPSYPPTSTQEWGR